MKKSIRLKCQCCDKDCDRLLICDFGEELIEINIESKQKGKYKIVGGVVVKKEDLLKIVK